MEAAYNAHSTAVELMWSGVPVLTAAGRCIRDCATPCSRCHFLCRRGRGPAAVVLRNASHSCRDSNKELLNLHRGMSARVGASLLLAHTHATSLARNSADLEALAVRVLASPRQDESTATCACCLFASQAQMMPCQRAQIQGT
jgi:hypothetical protein